MNRVGDAASLNRVMLWLVPLVAVALWLANGAATRPVEIKEVSINEARALIDSGALVVDVRDESAYQPRRIPGALSIPLDQLRRAIPASVADAKDKPIVVYCGDGVTTGPEGTQVLNNAGYGGAVNIRSGIRGWQDSGHPVQP